MTEDPSRDAPETRTQFSDERPAPAESGLPVEIGGYRILSRLGEGGMGVIYEAEQRNPHRRVAIKVIRGGAHVDEHRLRMFQREADSLARLKHPNIAAIHEAGRTDDGEHFFAMELVRGRTLDHYLRDRPTRPDEGEVEFRLGLFRKLCGAVHYAHQRGVIHRDLKPANVIVVEEPSAVGPPELKVLDFGLARITDADVAAASMVTEVGMIKGTLPYMSPEQARGNPDEIDIRTDVYALGVILYEMLTGRRPLDLSNVSIVDAVRAICEQAPVSLHDAWVGPGRPDADLVTIVTKALDKETERRYSGAANLGEDVQRYLASQPILARPSSSVYLLRKFAARNRTLVIGVLATFVALVGGVIVSTVFGVREAAQRRDAEAARDDLASVVEFQADMIAGLDPEQTGQRILDGLKSRIADAERRVGTGESAIAERLAAVDLAIRQVNPTDFARMVIDGNILEPAAETAFAEFAGRPEIESRLLLTIGKTYAGLGLRDTAVPHYKRAIEVLTRALGPNHTETMDAREVLARCHIDRNEYETAAALLTELSRDRLRELGSEHPDTLRTRSYLAGSLWQQGHDERAEAEFLETLAAQREFLGDVHRETIDTMTNLGVIYHHEGRYADAEPLWTAVLEHHRESDPEGEKTLETMFRLAGLYRQTGKLEPSLQLYVDALTIQRRTLGDDHPATLRTRSSLALLYKAMRRYAEAIRLQRETLEARRRVQGERHPLTLRSMNNLAMALHAADETDEAARLLADLVELDAEVQPESQDHAVHMHSLAELKMAEGEWAAARAWLERSAAIYARTKHRYGGLAHYQLGQIAARQGRGGDALRHLRQALDLGQAIELDAAEFSELKDDSEFRRLAADAAVAVAR